MQRKSADDRVLRFASRREGLIRGADAIRLGLTREQIRGRVQTGRWHRVTRDVFAIAGSPWTWQRVAQAALLAAPDAAVLSHTTAAAVWKLAAPPSRPHLIVPPAAGARIAGAHVHRAAVASTDRTSVGALPVTTVPRTLVDCASIMTEAQLCDMVDTALDSGRTTLRALGATMDRSGAFRGRRALAAALRPWTDPIAPESPAEARLLRRLEQWGFATPTRQHRVRDAAGNEIGRLDLAWEHERVGVEYDGRVHHGVRRFEADEARHAELVARGWRIVHADRLDLRPGDERLRIELSMLGLGRSSVHTTGEETADCTLGVRRG